MKKVCVFPHTLFLFVCDDPLQYTRIMNRIIRHLISKCDISSVVLIMKSVQIFVSVCIFISGLFLYLDCFFSSSGFARTRTADLSFADLPLNQLCWPAAPEDYWIISSANLPPRKTGATLMLAFLRYLRELGPFPRACHIKRAGAYVASVTLMFLLKMVFY